MLLKGFAINRPVRPATERNKGLSFGFDCQSKAARYSRTNCCKSCLTGINRDLPPFSRKRNAYCVPSQIKSHTRRFATAPARVPCREVPRGVRCRWITIKACLHFRNFRRFTFNDLVAFGPHRGSRIQDNDVTIDQHIEKSPHSSEVKLFFVGILPECWSK